MARLTAAQRKHLERARMYTFADGSGRGVIIQDGHDLRCFERMAFLGLVTITAANIYARITPAGRAALAKEVQP